MYDIIIIGAGPAGTTLARLLDEKYSILLIDKRNLSEKSDFKREKCCGGLLAPAAQKALAKQGLGIPDDILTGPQTFSVKSVDFDNGLTRYYQRHYININREMFDRWLVSLIPDNVEKRFSSLYKSYSGSEEGIKVRFKSEGRVHELETAVLVGADGAISRVRNQAFSDKAMPQKYISIQEHFKTKEILPYYVSVFDKEVTDFYSWIIQKKDELLVGTALENKKDIELKYKLLISKLRSRGFIKGEAVKRTGAVISRPSRLKQIHTCSDGIALVGEAAGLISPSSAEGISYALESGRLLAACLNKSTESFEKAYNRKLSGLKLNLLYKEMKDLLMYNRFIRKIIMKTRLLSMKVEDK